MATYNKMLTLYFFATLLITLTGGDPIQGVGSGPQRTILYQITERILLLQREFNLIMRQFERTILGFSGQQNNVATKVDVPTLPLVSPPSGKVLFSQQSDSNSLGATPLPLEWLPGRAQNALSVLTSPVYNPLNSLTRLINSTFEQILASLNFAISNRNINETIRSNVTG